jgi:sarcosine oxidase delta subunit
MNGERRIKCPICGEPYKVYMFTVADQSACPRCVRKAEQNSGKWDKGNNTEGR